MHQSLVRHTQCGKIIFKEALTFQWTWIQSQSKAELLQEGIFFLFHLFAARDVLIIKKLEIEKTKPTFIISVLKVEY